VSDHDLTELLNAWPHEPGQINVRRITGGDGRPKIQVRVELGVLQMATEDRPDGRRFDDFPSLLDLHRDRLARYIRRSGSEIGFVLTGEECRAMREEAVQYYHRYVAMFALGDFESVVRDTSRNLEVIDFCRQFAADSYDRTVLEQIRPSIISMRSRAEAEEAIAGRSPKQALAAIDRGLAQLRAVFEDANLQDAFESSNEVQLLRGMRDALVPKLPMSQRVELHDRLQAALDAENYELAAILRDELRLLGY
jgi:hypothetical protein